MIAALLVAVASGQGLPVDAGSYRPFYAPAPGRTEVEVAAFRMHATPVTNAQFLAFVQEHPRWDQGAVPALFADVRYLSHWAGPSDPGAADGEAPVVWVSWHAARAYCRASGGDLPTVDQWEYAADATATAPSGALADPATLSRILDWYARPGPPGRVGQGEPNHWGLHDLHGLIWEWTLDFNSLLVASDPREAGDEDDLRFCGAGAVRAEDAEDYATFMRSAFRSSLRADTTTANLGFRCAWPSP